MTEDKPIPEENPEASIPETPDIEPEGTPEASQAAASSASTPEEKKEGPGDTGQPAPPLPPPPQYAPSPPPPPLSPSDERTWAMLAHLSILANLVTGFLGPVVALVIYLVFKDRSKYVAYQSMQSFVFQLIFWVGAGILAVLAWTISGLLAVILVGCLLMPLALLISLIPIAALVYGVVGAVQCNQGDDFKYWLVGDWVRGTLTGN